MVSLCVTKRTIEIWRENDLEQKIYIKIMVADSEIERIDKEFVVQIMRERERMKSLSITIKVRKEIYKRLRTQFIKHLLWLGGQEEASQTGSSICRISDQERPWYAWGIEIRLVELKPSE